MSIHQKCEKVAENSKYKILKLKSSKWDQFWHLQLYLPIQASFPPTFSMVVNILMSTFGPPEGYIHTTAHSKTMLHTARGNHKSLQRKMGDLLFPKSFPKFPRKTRSHLGVNSVIYFSFMMIKMDFKAKVYKSLLVLQNTFQ